MNKINTYIDSGVLIAAFQGTTNVAVKATEILDDPQREYATIAILFELCTKYLCFREQGTGNS